MSAHALTTRVRLQPVHGIKLPSPPVCSYLRGAPRQLLNTIREYEAVSGRNVRFRSFTILRSPLVLAHSQFNYWHHASAVPRQLYYQLSPEMLLFQDTLKLINDEGPVCIDDEVSEIPKPGGRFLALQPPGGLESRLARNARPLEKRGNGRVCSAGPWQLLCQQLMLALLTSEDMRQQQGWFRLKHEFLRHNAELLAANDVSANAPAQNAASSRWSCSKQTWAADLDKSAKSVAAVAPDAPYAELEAALAGMCPAQRLKLLQVTGCLVDRARRVEKTMLEVGCDGVIRQAFDRLDQLSHVLFLDTSMFSLEHAFEMAAEQTGVASGKRWRTNIGVTHVPIIQSEIEPFNRCSHRFWAYHDKPAPNALKTDFPCLFCVCRWGGVRQIHGARSAL